MGTKVLIGCKLPNGIILELIPPPPKEQKDQKLFPPPPGRRVTIKGSNSLRSDTRRAQLDHEFAITEVDEGFWKEWIGRPENRDLEFIKKGLVFAADNVKDSTAKQRDARDQKTGLEALDMRDKDKPDARLPKGKSPSTRVEGDPSSLGPRDNDTRQSVDA